MPEGPGNIVSGELGVVMDVKQPVRLREVKGERFETGGGRWLPKALGIPLFTPCWCRRLVAIELDEHVHNIVVLCCQEGVERSHP